MTKQIKLTVNNVPIDLDFFVEGYIYHTVSGILSSLRDTGEIENLKLTIDNEGKVAIYLNNADVEIGYFPVLIIKSTLEGMVAPLKGVDSPVNTLEINISS